MTDYGLIFREFRHNRQLNLADVADEQVSISQLSRFERGESELTVSKFFHVLEKIHITPSQFMNKVNDYRRVDQIRLMSKMGRLHYKNDIAGLELLLLEEEKKVAVNPKDQGARLNAILLKGVIADLDDQRLMAKEDLEFVADHLFCTEEWLIEELILIGNLYQFYETDFICRLVNEVVARTEFYMDVPEHKKLVEVILLNVILTFTERRALRQASYYDQILQPLLSNERQVYHRLIYLYVKGFLKYVQGNQDGRTDMEHAISAFDWIGNHHHAKTYRKHYQKFVEQK